MQNFKLIGQGVRGLRLPKIGGFPLTLNVALTTVLRTNVLHCDLSYINSLFHVKLEIRSMERGICPIAVFYFALKRSFFNI